LGVLNKVRQGIEKIKNKVSYGYYCYVDGILRFCLLKFFESSYYIGLANLFLFLLMSLFFTLLILQPIKAPYVKGLVYICGHYFSGSYLVSSFKNIFEFSSPQEVSNSGILCFFASAIRLILQLIPDYLQVKKKSLIASVAARPALGFSLMIFLLTHLSTD